MFFLWWPAMDNMFFIFFSQNLICDGMVFKVAIILLVENWASWKRQGKRCRLSFFYRRITLFNPVLYQFTVFIALSVNGYIYNIRASSSNWLCRGDSNAGILTVNLVFKHVNV